MDNYNQQCKRSLPFHLLVLVLSQSCWLLVAKPIHHNMHKQTKQASEEASNACMDECIACHGLLALPPCMHASTHPCPFISLCACPSFSLMQLFLSLPLSTKSQPCPCPQNHRLILHTMELSKQVWIAPPALHELSAQILVLSFLFIIHHN